MSQNDDPTTSDPVPDVAESLILLDKAKDGDAQAFGDLLARYEDRVRRIVSVRLGAKLRALTTEDDLIQEVFIEAIKSLRSVEPRDHASIIGWLATVAQRRIADNAKYFERERRSASRTTALDDSNDPDGQGPGPRTLVSRSEVREQLDRALEELDSAEHREVILLRDYHGGDWEFVRARMGRDNVKAVQELHRRARKKLGEKVKRRLGDS